MSCQAKANTVARAAGQNGTSAQANLAAGLAAQNKQIIISDVRYDGKGRYLVIRKKGQRSRTVPLQGQTINISGPVQLVSTPDGAWWINTSARIEGVEGGSNDQKAEKVLQNRQKDKLTVGSVGQKTRLLSEAIRHKRQIEVEYRTSKSKQRHTLIPLDVRPGQKQYKNRRFLIAYAEAEGKMRRLRLELVTAIKVSQVAFDPEAIRAKARPKSQRTWHLPREWAAKSGQSAAAILKAASTQFETLDWQLEEDSSVVRILDLDPGRRPGAARAVLKQVKDAGYKLKLDHPAKSTLPFWQTMYQEGFIDEKPDRLPTREDAMAQWAESSE